MSDTQAPDPRPPPPVPRPPRPACPERDVPERDDPDEPEPEKPPTPLWRNEAKVWAAAVALGTLLALTQPAVAQLRELMSAARAECQAKALSKAHDKDPAGSSQARNLHSSCIGPGTAAAHAIADEIESGEVTPEAIAVCIVPGKFHASPDTGVPLVVVQIYHCLHRRSAL